MSDTTITSIDGHNRSAPAGNLPTNMSIGMTVFNSTTGETMVETGVGLVPNGPAMDKSFFYNAPVSGPVFIANRPCTIKAITIRPLVAGTDAGAVTLVVRKAPSGTAITAGTALHSGSANLKGAVDVNQILTLSATPADIAIAVGDAIGFHVTGVTTAATGVVSIEIAPA